MNDVAVKKRKFHSTLAGLAGALLMIFAGVILLYANATGLATGTACTDTDGGDDIFTQGTTTQTTGGQGTVRTDSCNGKNHVTEFYCDGNVRRYKVLVCEFGCTEGACRKEAPPTTFTCTDTDAEDATKQGKATVMKQQYATPVKVEDRTDLCKDDKTLIEFSCASPTASFITNVTQPCAASEKCRRGACIGSVPDLRAASVQLLPGKNFANVTICNDGTPNAATTALVVYYEGADMTPPHIIDAFFVHAGDDAIIGLRGDSCRSLPAFLPRARPSLISAALIVDPLQKVTEIDEDNNYVAGTISLPSS